MEIPTIDPGSTWKHKRDGYEAKVQPGRYVTKDADDAAWQTAVAFTRPDEDNQTHQRTYIRAARDFAGRFELADTEPQEAAQPPAEPEAPSEPAAKPKPARKKKAK